jgi:hypothetical protein
VKLNVDSLFSHVDLQFKTWLRMADWLQFSAVFSEHYQVWRLEQQLMLKIQHQCLTKSLEHHKMQQNQISREHDA